MIVRATVLFAMAVAALAAAYISGGTVSASTNATKDEAWSKRRLPTSRPKARMKPMS
jgi:hypothetical protein